MHAEDVRCANDLFTIERRRGHHGAFGPVVASRAMTELFVMAARAAESPATVLITGESGVGKDWSRDISIASPAAGLRSSWR